MRRFIFAERSGIYLIDLQKTVQQLEKAREQVREVVMRGDGVLFVCTKRQLKQVVRDEAIRCDSFYVTERWLGGILTNFHTIKQQIRRLRDIEQGQEEGAFEFFTKKERLRIDRERQKLNRNLEGIKRMGRLPGAIFVVDALRERIAIAEANKLKIPVIAIVDTNADPDLITVPIPGNDDAIRSVSLITKAIVDVVAEARSQVPLRETAPAEGEAYTYSTDSGGQQGDVDEHRKRRRTRRKRRPKPEAIVARLKASDGGEGEGRPSGSEGESQTSGGEAEADVSDSGESRPSGGGGEGQPSGAQAEADSSDSGEVEPRSARARAAAGGEAEG